MHSERVTRHCKGIQQALTEVRNRFTNMKTEHDNLATKFRQDIEALEVVFINATKASKYVQIQNTNLISWVSYFFVRRKEKICDYCGISVISLSLLLSVLLSSTCMKRL